MRKKPFFLHSKSAVVFLILIALLGVRLVSADENRINACGILPKSCRVGSATEEKGEPPILIDRINNPESWLSFSFDEGAELLHLYFPQVLNTDAMLLVCGGETMLIDCSSAKQASRVTALLSYLDISHLDTVLNTHPHYDHLQGLDHITESVSVGRLMICFSENETVHMQNAMRVCKEKGIPVVHFGDGDRLNLSGAVLDIWMKADEDWSLNEASAQIRLQYGDRTALLTADMMLKTQLRLLEVIDPALLDIDILKYPHHGLNALHDDFIAATAPLMAVITNNGKTFNSHYCLNMAGIPSCTTVPGYVHCVTDGKRWIVERISPSSGLK